MLLFRALIILSVTLTLVARPAHAAGIYFGDNGLRALSMGGAFVGQADDLSAFSHNPAGLTQLQGFHFLVEAQLVQHDIRFQRTHPDVPPGLLNEVKNEAGLFNRPGLAVGYGARLAGRRFTASFGVYGPPAVGKLEFPEPNYTRGDNGQYLEDPRRFAPQRYSLISYDILIAYPSLSAAYELHRTFEIGVTAQYVVSSFELRRAVHSNVTTPANPLREDPYDDSVVTQKLHGNGRIVPILGVRYAPSERLSFGAMLRPQVPITADGTAKFELGGFATERVKATVEGEDVTLKLTLPLEARVGAHVKPLPPLGLNADLVYQRWSSLQTVQLIHKDVALRLNGGEPRALGTINVPQNWKDSWGVRVGGEWAFPMGLSVRAGALLEQGTSPDEYVNIEFLNFSRLMLTSGVSYALGPVELLGTFVWAPTVTRTIETSQVRAVNADSAIEGSLIGNGVYESGGYIAGFGIRGHFGGQSAASFTESQP